MAMPSGKSVVKALLGELIARQNQQEAREREAAARRKTRVPPPMPNVMSPWASELTRTGELNLTNRKPFRSKAGKARAAASASKRADGAFRSSEPVSFHAPFKA